MFPSPSGFLSGRASFTFPLLCTQQNNVGSHREVDARAVLQKETSIEKSPTDAPAFPFCQNHSATVIDHVPLSLLRSDQDSIRAHRHKLHLYPWTSQPAHPLPNPFPQRFFHSNPRPSRDRTLSRRPTTHKKPHAPRPTPHRESSLHSPRRTATLHHQRALPG
jgi:hypothetical protein